VVSVVIGDRLRGGFKSYYTTDTTDKRIIGLVLTPIGAKPLSPIGDIPGGN